MSIGKRILERRLVLSLSQEELALRVGCSQDLISKLENGKRNKTSLILKFAEVLEVEAKWLETGEEISNSGLYLTPELKAHIKVLQDLPDYARTEVIRDAIKTAELVAKAKEDRNGTKK
jgi:transcriptional regulator with XRE-family HTH domain